MMNESKGNMYSWCTHTWNAVRGKCPHGCSYCFMLRFLVGELRLDEKALQDDLGNGHIVFVGSSIDMWADDIPGEWIIRTLEHCNKYPGNIYFFQSKNPNRFDMFLNKLPKNIILGTTIESNINHGISKAPSPEQRYKWMKNLSEKGYKTMISIEPIMDFDVAELFSWIHQIKPSFVSIGANSQNHKLKEPDKHKIMFLIEQLEQAKIVIKQKKNLERLIK